MDFGEQFFAETDPKVWGLRIVWILIILLFLKFVPKIGIGLLIVTLLILMLRAQGVAPAQTTKPGK